MCATLLRNSPQLFKKLWFAQVHLPLLRTSIRVLVGPMIMARDASLSGGAICRSTDLTARRLFASHLAARQHIFCSDDEVILICLGDELGARRRACELLKTGIAAFVRNLGEPTAERVCKHSRLM